jgi:hypothetical protein
MATHAARRSRAVYRLAVFAVVIGLLVASPSRFAHASGTTGSNCSGTTNCAPPGTQTQFPVNNSPQPTCSGSTPVYDQSTGTCVASPTTTSNCPSGWVAASGGGCTNPNTCPTGYILANWSAGGQAGCVEASFGCPYHETLVGDVCQGTATLSGGGSGSYPQWTFTCTGNGVATQYTHNTYTGAVISVEYNVPESSCSGYSSTGSGSGSGSTSGSCSAPGPTTQTIGPFVSGCAGVGEYSVVTEYDTITWSCPGPTPSASFSSSSGTEATADCQPIKIVDHTTPIACVAGLPGWAWSSYTYQNCLTFEGGYTDCGSTQTYTPPTPYQQQTTPFAEPVYNPVACPVPTPVGT